jgi:hypothetical protein
MGEYMLWLENWIEVSLEDKDLKREHWAFCQALRKYRELVQTQVQQQSKVKMTSSEEKLPENMTRVLCEHRPHTKGRRGTFEFAFYKDGMF